MTDSSDSQSILDTWLSLDGWGDTDDSQPSEATREQPAESNDPPLPVVAEENLPAPTEDSEDTSHLPVVSQLAGGVSLVPVVRDLPVVAEVGGAIERYSPNLPVRWTPGVIVPYVRNLPARLAEATLFTYLLSLLSYIVSGLEPLLRPLRFIANVILDVVHRLLKVPVGIIIFVIYFAAPFIPWISALFSLQWLLDIWTVRSHPPTIHWVFTVTAVFIIIGGIITGFWIDDIYDKKWEEIKARRNAT